MEASGDEETASKMETSVTGLKMSAQKNKVIDNLEKDSSGILDKGYQLDGVFSKFVSQVPPQHAAYFRKNINELQDMGHKLGAEITNLHAVFKESAGEQTNSRKIISQVTSENFKLKRKLDDYESDLFDECVSSQEAPKHEESHAKKATPENKPKEDNEEKTTGLTQYSAQAASAPAENTMIARR